MCEFKSGIIFKNRVILAPMYDDRHSALLSAMNIEDDQLNASKMFVRAELIPNNEKTSDVSEWIFKVDQDILPDWYEEDPERYEEEFRKEVKTWMKDRFQVICGQLCTKIKEDENGTYYKTVHELFSSQFGSDNNYATSYIRAKLNECDFANALRKEYGNRLVPIHLDLLSMDESDDYGCIEGDILSLMDIDLYRQCRKNFPNHSDLEWLATPNSTPSFRGSSHVRCFLPDGDVNVVVEWDGDVRPFFILKPEESSGF